MASLRRFASVAVVRGEMALLVFHGAVQSGGISGEDVAVMKDALESWLQMSRRADSAQGLGYAFEHGVGADDPRRLLKLFDDYRASIDELPSGVS